MNLYQRSVKHGLWVELCIEYKVMKECKMVWRKQYQKFGIAGRVRSIITTDGSYVTYSTTNMSVQLLIAAGCF